MTRVVHLQTKVQTMFGLLDDDGNVTPQQPAVIQIDRFTAQAFTDAYQTLAQARDHAAGEPPQTRT